MKRHDDYFKNQVKKSLNIIFIFQTGLFSQVLLKGARMKLMKLVIAILLITFLALGSTNPTPTAESSILVTDVDVGAVQQAPFNGTEKDGDQKTGPPSKTTWYSNTQVVVLIGIVVVVFVVFLMTMSDLLFWMKPDGCSCAFCNSIKSSL